MGDSGRFAAIDRPAKGATAWRPGPYNTGLEQSLVGKFIAILRLMEDNVGTALTWWTLSRVPVTSVLT